MLGKSENFQKVGGAVRTPGTPRPCLEINIYDRFVCLGAFNDVDRTFLSEHAALGLENQQLQVEFLSNFCFRKKKNNVCCRDEFLLVDIRQQ